MDDLLERYWPVTLIALILVIFLSLKAVGPAIDQLDQQRKAEIPAAMKGR